MDDALSEIFRLIRLRSCVYFQRDFFAPWAMRIEGTGFAQFHVVTRGNCCVEIDGVSVDCSVGDVLLFPRGGAHTLADRPGRAPVSGPEVIASFTGDMPYFAHGATSTRVICGHYEYRSEPRHPLIGDLPELIHVRSLDLLAGASATSVVGLLMDEIANPSAGSTSVVERLAEVLLVVVLRAYVAQEPARLGFHRGLVDRRLARAINRIHHDYSARLGLTDLAEAATMSRSSFAQHFKDTTGIAPIEYLAKWRMITAMDLLVSTSHPIPEISERVGYDSDIAFARAFKREFGKTPAQYRRGA